jgi:hypothetical protein
MKTASTQAGSVELKLDARRVGRVVSDSTGRSPEEVGALAVVAVVAIGVVTALRAAELVQRLWTPSGRRL